MPDKFLSSAGRNRGAVTLFTVVVIGGIVIEAAVASLLVSHLISQEGLGARMAYAAALAAQAGIDDALMKVIWNKDFTPSQNPYSLTVNNVLVQVAVCKDKTSAVTMCDTVATGKYEITALAIALNKYNRLRIIAGVDSITGAVTVESVRDLSG